MHQILNQYTDTTMSRSHIILYLIALLTACSPAARLTELPEPQTGSWGDQGNGWFINPVLNSNYPDSDIERLGDKWYMISSKGCYMNGMTVLESCDLVNWNIIGGVVDRLTWDTTEGVWAGDLSYHEGKWICHFIDFDKGLFVCTADDIRGPWTKPELMLDRQGMTDPAAYWDHRNGQAYLLCNHRIEKTPHGKLYHLRLFKMSWDGKAISDDGTDIYNGIGAEAAKIYQFNGKFYIFISEWLMGSDGERLDRRQIVLRADRLEGPFEKKVLLEKGNGTDRSCCQGSLLQIQDSSWWYMHQLVQSKESFEGRPQCLIPARWEDGWPILGEDSNGNGIGNIVWKSRKPIPGFSISIPDTDDDFNSARLANQWLWNGNPIDDKWSLTRKKGWLRLYSTMTKTPENPFKGLPNLILQRKMGKGRDTVTVKMSVSGMADGQFSGLVFSGQNYHAVGVSKTPEGLVFREESKNGFTEIPLGSKTVYLRILADGRNTLCHVSQDSKNYRPLGEACEIATAGFNGIFIGLFSRNGSEEGYADFDWFSYKYDGPKTRALSKLK